ncbi:Uu.00g067450.m01.CDS01 [Anthostomella pinea]|uniref:Uu.00g067450.m01.CDS01 n=1 Tax=Anthostomella pinea TaxID=933095 RepID=A0AAI8YNF1_9PEZI|nr:Uu.00g067450.m01.CDS01 [Anthostomella pinea]
MSSPQTTHPSPNRFSFLVGAEKKEYLMNRSIVTGLSPFFATLVGGPFREIQDKFATFPEIKEFVFQSFYDFAYTGNYELVPETDSGDENNTESDLVIENPFFEPGRVDSESSGSEDSFDAELRYDRGQFGSLRHAWHRDWSRHDQEDCPLHARIACIVVFRLGHPPHQVYDLTNDQKHDFWLGTTSRLDLFNPDLRFPPQGPSPDTHVEYRDMMRHAEIYVFAEQYNIQLLREISLHKLHLLLLHWSPSADPLLRMNELFVSIYTNTARKRDPARWMVAWFAAWLQAYITCKYDPLEWDLEPAVRRCPELGANMVTCLINPKLQENGKDYAFPDCWDPYAMRTPYHVAASETSPD